MFIPDVVTISKENAAILKTWDYVHYKFFFIATFTRKGKLLDRSELKRTDDLYIQEWQWQILDDSLNTTDIMIGKQKPLKCDDSWLPAILKLYLNIIAAQPLHCILCYLVTKTILLSRIILSDLCAGVMCYICEHKMFNLWGACLWFDAFRVIVISENSCLSRNFFLHYMDSVFRMWWLLKFFFEKTWHELSRWENIYTGGVKVDHCTGQHGFKCAQPSSTYKVNYGTTRTQVWSLCQIHTTGSTSCGYRCLAKCPLSITLHVLWKF